MKKIILTIIVILFGGLMIMGFNIFKDQKNELKDFDYFKITESGMEAGYYSYEVKKVDDGITIDYAHASEYWSDSANDYIEDKRLIRSVKKDLNTYDEIIELLKEYKVHTWDGFNKSNPNVLDGGSIGFTLKLNGETLVEARGSNTAPKNFYKLFDYIRNAVLLDVVKDTSFESARYSVTLPSSWVDKVGIRYGIEYVAFYLDINDEEKSFFIIYDYPYEITNVSDYTLIGTLEKENEEIHYLYTNVNDCRYLADKLNDNQKLIIDSLDKDVVEINESFKAINDYKLNR